MNIKNLYNHYLSFFVYGAISFTYIPYVIIKPSSLFPKYRAQSKPNSTKYMECFKRYATIKYNEHYYITPKDFLNILLHIGPKKGKIVKIFTDSDIKALHSNLENLIEDKMLFRQIGQNGIISFSEYEFLRYLMNKSLSKLEIIFKLLDKNKNYKIDKEEFIKVEQLVIATSASSKQKGITNSQKTLDTLDVDISTTLLALYFGLNGNRSLTFERFKRFIQNLREEVWHAEFNHASSDKDSFTAVDFALLLFKKAQLPPIVLKSYVDRIKLRIPFNTEISWEEYRQLCTFLTHLDDFCTILNVHSIASYDISQKDFKRAVYLSSGIYLTPRLCDVIFAIFDHNEDGFIDHSEFVRLVKRSRRYSGLYMDCETEKDITRSEQETETVMDIGQMMHNWYLSFTKCVSQHLRYQ